MEEGHERSKMPDAATDPNRSLFIKAVSGDIAYLIQYVKQPLNRLEWSASEAFVYDRGTDPKAFAINSFIGT
jgi:hypothetical protein